MPHSDKKNASIVEQGFLLTRQTVDVNGSNQVILWVKTLSGPVQLVIEHQQPLFFIEQHQYEKASKLLSYSDRRKVTFKPLSLKTFGQQQVVGVYFQQLRDFYAIRTFFKEHKIKCYEDDFRPDERFLIERFITAKILFSGELVEQSAKSYRTVTEVKCKQSDDKALLTTSLLSVVSIDIECSMQGELYSIGLYSENSQTVLMIGQAEQFQQEIDFELVWLEDEKALLNALNEWVAKHDPDIFIGWNVINFDFALLQKRFDLHKIPFTLGRDGSEPRWRQQTQSEQLFIDIAGRVVIDGIDMLKSATYRFSSFSLESVAQELLGVGKKVENVDNRVAEITHNFHHNKLALATYNLEDCRLVTKIFEKTLLFDFAMLRAHLTGLSLDRIGGSVAAFTNLYLPKLHRAGYVAPNMGDGLKGLTSPGGYVMDSIPGLYKNVLVLDFKSLYPSIIRTFNIDPMGMIEGLLNKENAISGFDGAYFSREEHFLPQIIKTLWSERDKAKRDNNAALSQAIKIIMNSFYGVLGSTGCRFFDPRLSGSITKRSHEILKTTQAWIESKGFKVIYGDTDSIFIHAGNDKTAQESITLGQELANFINTHWDEDLDARFAVKSYLEIEFETHFEQFFMPTIRGVDNQKQTGVIGTKKRYAGLIDKNGDKQLVFKGMETVRSDWTALSKEFQQELYMKVFKQEPVDDYVKSIVSRLYSKEFDDLLVYRKRLTRKLDQYVKNIPPHVKAARHADELNLKNGKPLKYQKKGWIEYVMTLEGPQVIEYAHAPLDYDFYRERQLKPIADDILPFIDCSFDQITDKQMQLF
ncbi:DNA polymerase II [Thalassotalea ganghwensis]